MERLSLASLGPMNRRRGLDRILGAIGYDSTRDLLFRDLQEEEEYGAHGEKDRQSDKQRVGPKQAAEAALRPIVIVFCFGASKE
jgi:hypothetical protein